MGINYKIIGKKIRLARKYRGMSQEEFAEKTFSNQNQISLLETAKSGIDNLRKLEYVCEILRIELSDLLFLEEDEFMTKLGREEVERPVYEWNDNPYNILSIDKSDKRFKDIKGCINRYSEQADMDGFICYRIGLADYKTRTVSMNNDISSIFERSYREKAEEMRETLKDEDIQESEYLKSVYEQELAELDELAEEEKEHIDYLMRMGEIETEDEYYSSAAAEDYLVVDDEDIAIICAFLYGQDFNPEDFSLSSVDHFSPDCAYLDFDTRESVKEEASFSIFYNKENQTCEVYKRVWQMGDVFITAYDSVPAQDVKDAIETGLILDEADEILEWAYENRLCPSYVDRIKFKELKRLYDKRH